MGCHRKRLACIGRHHFGGQPAVSAVPWHPPRVSDRGFAIGRYADSLVLRVRGEQKRLLFPFIYLLLTPSSFSLPVFAQTIGVYTLAHAYFKALQFNMRRPWALPAKGVGSTTSSVGGPPNNAGSVTVTPAMTTPTRSIKKGRGKQTKARKQSSSSTTPLDSPSMSTTDAPTSANGGSYKIGAAFHYSHNMVLFVVASVPLFVTCYVAWIVVRGFHSHSPDFSTVPRL